LSGCSARLTFAKIDDWRGKSMSDTKKNIENALIAYSEMTVFRAMINTIPYVGGSIDVMLSNNAQKITGRRINLLLETLKNDVKKVKEEVIDREYLETEEFFDLIRKIMEATIKTRDNEKIQLYSRILCNAMLKDSAAKNLAEDYLSVLAELSLRELHLAKVIYRMQYNKIKQKNNELQMAVKAGWNDLPNKAKILANELDFLLKRLERTGLIKEITGGYTNYSGGVYIITPTFVSLMNYLKEKM
jgi:hypothetical protein